MSLDVRMFTVGPVAENCCVALSAMLALPGATATVVSFWLTVTALLLVAVWLNVSLIVTVSV